MLVHVIKPSGTRFEYTFPDNAADTEILAALESVKHQYGYNGRKAGVDNIGGINLPADHADPESGLVWDNPELQVVIIETTVTGKGRERIEKVVNGPDGCLIVRHLRGKPEEKPKTETPVAEAKTLPYSAHGGPMD